MAKGKNKSEEKELLYRVQKFELKPDEDQISVLKAVSANLLGVYNDALKERDDVYKKYHLPFYKKLAIVAKFKKNLRKEYSSRLDDLERIMKDGLKTSFKKHSVTLFDQINDLTKRRENEDSVPRNWQEETLDTLNGAFTSFMSLRKNGDLDAKPPKARRNGYFYEIVGRFGFKLMKKGGLVFFVLSCKKLSGETRLEFPVPFYQQQKLSEAVRLKKFTLYRDEKDLEKPGRFWVSLAYEIQKPESVSYRSDDLVFVSLGASSLGVITSKKEMVIDLWRPDKHWKPKIEAVETAMKTCQKGSRKWRKLNDARRKMQKLYSAQQKQNHREVVSLLLKLGKHFVVSDFVVRSKKGKLADGAKPERGGSMGLNWQAQNTGSFGELVGWLSEKAREFGGSVRKHKIILDEPLDAFGRDAKIPMVRVLKQTFLQSA